MASQQTEKPQTSAPGGPDRPKPTSSPGKAEPYADSPSKQSQIPAAAKKSQVGFRMISAMGYPDFGVFRMAEALFGWKKDDPKPSSKDAPLKCIRQSKDIKSIQWAPISSKDHILLFNMNDESILPFMGFKESDFVTIQRFVRHHWKMEIEVTKRATRGWHWGQYDFIGDSMVMSINNDPAIYFNASQIRQITAGKSKNELLIGFDEEDNAPSNQDLVYEVKLHIVPYADEEGKDDKQASHVEYLYDSLLAKSNLTTATASNVAFILEYMNLASPPGRFDIHVVRDGFKLYGKSGNFGPIPWSHVEGIYHLETKPNGYLFLELNSALKKGQTNYRHIVIQLDDRKHREISLNLAKDGPTDQRLIDEYKLQPLIKSEERKVVPKLLAIYGAKKPIRAVMKETDTDNPKPMEAIDASYKQQLGKLSLHANCIIFAPKPPTLIKHDAIAVVDFRSPSTRTRLFTFRIIMKAPRGATPVEHSLESIDRSEFDGLLKYFMDRNIKTRTGTLDDGTEGTNNEPNDIPPDEESSEDEDFEHDDKNDSSDHGDTDLESDDGTSDNDDKN